MRRAALLALGELVADYEAAKTALGATLGGAALAQALRGCPALLDRAGGRGGDQHGRTRQERR